MPSFAGARELRGLLGLGRNVVQGAGVFLGPQLFMQGRSGSALDRGVQNLPGIIPDPRNDTGRNLGRSLVNELQYMGGQLGRGSLPYLGNEMRYAAGQLSQGNVPYTNASFGGTKPFGDQRNYGPGYKEKELAAGQAAESFRPGAGFPGQQAAADRAYEAEKSRVAQITAQDPELQRYEAARKIAAAPGATPEQVQSAEDIGMQMWAKANPQLAAKVRPGQSGYDAIQGSLAGQAASQGYGYQLPQQMLMTPPPGVNAPQGLPGISSFGATSTYGQQGLQIDPEMEKKFQALLNQAQK